MKSKDKPKEKFGTLSDKGTYLEILQERGKTSKVYQKHQLIGLEIAELLGDESHKSFYMKLAKGINAERLLGIAKDVALRKQIRNKGAYFMKIIHDPYDKK
ncbi:MAG TPA: hypothetical protein VJK04_03235 [Candidatus Paceibacterota bacterium]